MSTNANFIVDIDTTPARNKLVTITNEASRIDQSITKTVSKIHAAWGFSMHIMSLIISNLSRSATTQEQQAQIQDWQFGMQVAQTEISVAYTAYRATVAGIEGQWLKMAGLIAVGSLMQAQMGQIIQARQENQQIKQYIARNKMFTELYR